MKSLSILLVAVSLFAVSCERHEFEGPDGTKQLHVKHGHDDHAEDAGHEQHAGHDEHEEHGKKAGH